MVKKILAVMLITAILFAGVATIPMSTRADTVNAEVLFPTNNKDVPIWYQLTVNIHITDIDAFWAHTGTKALGFSFNGIVPYIAHWKLDAWGSLISFEIDPWLLIDAYKTFGENVNLIVYNINPQDYSDAVFYQVVPLHLVTDAVKIKVVRFDTTKIPWGKTLIQQSEWLTLNTVQSFLTTWKQLGKEDEVQTLWVTSAATGLSDTWEIRIGAGEPCVCFIVDVYKVMKVQGQQILLHVSSAYPDTILSYISDFQTYMETSWTGKLQGMSNYSPESCFSLSWKVIH